MPCYHVYISSNHFYEENHFTLAQIQACNHKLFFTPDILAVDQSVHDAFDQLGLIVIIFRFVGLEMLAVSVKTICQLGLILSFFRFVCLENMAGSVLSTSGEKGLNIHYYQDKLILRMIKTDKKFCLNFNYIDLKIILAL